MNFLNRFSHLDDNDYYECDDNVNSFKPSMKKETNFQATATVQDTNPEFKLTKELFPSLTKSVKTVPVQALASLSFSKIITSLENVEEVVSQVEEKELDVMREGWFVAVFNKKTRMLNMPKVVVARKVPAEEEAQVVKEANQVLNKLNELHIRRSKEYLFTWGEDEFIRTFLSERDVESAPIFLKTS